MTETLQIKTTTVRTTTTAVRVELQDGTASIGEGPTNTRMGQSYIKMLEIPDSRVEEVATLFASLLKDARRLEKQRELERKREEITKLESELEEER